MKNFSRCLGFAAGVALCLAGTAGAFAAVVDKTAPYEGEYFIAYNDHIGYPHSISSGPLPASLFGEEDGTESAGAAEFDVMDIRETKDGETVYRLEPRDLEDRIAPPAASPRRAAPARQGGPARLGDEREFITVDVETNESSHTPFVLKYAGEYCNLWLERDDARGITDEMAAELGMEYDVKIHGRMLTAFGPTYDRDGDGKLAILLYDIQDGFSGYGGYVGGFFMLADLYGEKFNCMDVIHIDTWPSIDASEPDPLAEVKSTMVHELQHLIEFSHCIERDRRELPLWINEGLSMAAEHMIYGALESRIRYYNEEAYWNTPLADWMSDMQDSLSNYAYSYLFFQYLRSQTKNFTGGGEELFRYILQSERRSALAVERGMRQFYPYITISDIFRNFHIALTLNEPTGLYGFAGEPEFDDVQPKLYPDSGDYISLGNGAAIVKRMESESYTPEAEGREEHLQFAAFTPGGDSVDAPKANVLSGEVYQFKNVSLSCAERYATMYYTLDGSEPDESSTVYTGKPILLLSDTTLKAVTIAPDGRRSAVVEYAYTLEQPDVEIRRPISCHSSPADSYGIIQTPDGGLLQVGSASRDDVGVDDFYEVRGYAYETCRNFVYCAKYTQDGLLQWISTFGGEWVADAYDVEALEDGFAIVGYSRRAGEDHYGDFEGIPFEEGERWIDKKGEAAYIAKFDWNGVKQWVCVDPLYNTEKLIQRDEADGTIYGSYGKTYRSLSVCPDGGVVACGETEIIGPSGYHSLPSIYNSDREFGRPIIAKTDAQGNYCWKKELDFPAGSGAFYGVTVLEDGTIVAAGWATQNALGKGDMSLCASESEEPSNQFAVPLLVAFDQNGSILWERALNQYSGEDHRWLSYLSPTEDGFVASMRQGSYDILRFSADASGCDLLWESWAPSSYNDFQLCSTEDGILAVGSVNNTSMLALKLDFDTGKHVWTKQYTNGVPPYAMAPLGDRRYVVASSRAFAIFYDESIPHYTVSGNVGLPGVSIGGKLSDSQGNYTVKVMEGESAVLTPTLAGYTFSPKSRTVGPMTGPVNGVDFTPRERVYTFKGRVLDKDGSPLAGVTVAKGVVTGEDGTYVLKARPGSTVLLEPQLEGKSFEPASITRTAVTEGERGLDFRVLKPMYTVSGKVTRNGAGQGGVEVFRNVLTGPDGTYSFTVEEGTKVSLAPGFQKYRFEPAVASLGAVTEDREQDFAMLPLPFLLRASPLRVSFDPVVEGETFPQAVTVTVRNLEGDPCTGLAVFQEEDSDFEVSALSRDTVSVGDGGVTFTVKPKADLARGAYTATVQLRQGETVVLTVPVTFTVEEVKPPEEPDPEEPDPEEPDPDKPDPDKPDPDKPDPDKPDPDKPDPDKPDPDKPDPDKPGPDKPEPDKPDDPKPSTPSTGGGSGGGHSVAPPKAETPTQATHAAYLQGYPDGCFHPDDTLTRAQCAAMLSRLDPAFDPERFTVSLPFSDTGAERWFAPYLSFCHQRGLVRGYPDGTFRPDGAMTRGEFASVVRNALALESAGEEFFPDTEKHWARYPIAQLVQAGILDGYPDGTFRPDEPVTRAEAAKILNRVWQRPGTEEHLAEVPAPEYPDLPQSHWAYWEIWEASVSHPAEKK